MINSLLTSDILATLKKQNFFPEKKVSATFVVLCRFVAEENDSVAIVLPFYKVYYRTNQC